MYSRFSIRTYGAAHFCSIQMHPNLPHRVRFSSLISQCHVLQAPRKAHERKTQNGFYFHRCFKETVYGFSNNFHIGPRKLTIAAQHNGGSELVGKILSEMSPSQGTHKARGFGGTSGQLALLAAMTITATPWIRPTLWIFLWFRPCLFLWQRFPALALMLCLENRMNTSFVVQVWPIITLV